jgi:hypothetical protein
MLCCAMRWDGMGWDGMGWDGIGMEQYANINVYSYACPSATTDGSFFQACALFLDDDNNNNNNSNNNSRVVFLFFFLAPLLLFPSDLAMTRVNSTRLDSIRDDMI